MFLVACSRLASPVNTTIGVPAFSDFTRPVARFVAPGPSVRVADARPVGDTRVGVGGEGADALVIDQEVPQPERATAS